MEFCGNCGKPLEENSTFCPYCGAAVEEDEPEGKEDPYAKIFVEPDETCIASLGDGYVRSFLTSEKLKRCIAFLSEKRVYLRGNMINVNGGKVGRVNQQQTVDLEDITGTGFIYDSAAIWKLFVGVMLCVIGAVFVVFGIGVVGIIAGIFLIVSYFLGRHTLFFIEYAGGCIKFDASIYGLAESQDFEKQIRRAKDKAKGKL